MRVIMEKNGSLPLGFAASLVIMVLTGWIPIIGALLAGFIGGILAGSKIRGIMVGAAGALIGAVIFVMFISAIIIGAKWILSLFGIIFVRSAHVFGITHFAIALIAAYTLVGAIGGLIGGMVPGIGTFNIVSDGKSYKGQNVNISHGHNPKYIFCAKCGAQNTDGSKYCKSCGNRMMK